MGKNRLEAFSDGVLAIIITIMVLEMKVPHGEKLDALLPLVPVFLSYVLSFIYVGIYWNNHHHLLHTVHKVSGPILWANLHLLFWLSLFPFATGWMGENHFAPLPTAIYGVVLLMAGIAYLILQHFIIVLEGEHSVLKRAIGRDWKGKASQLSYLAAIGASFWSPGLAQALYVLVALLWLVPDRRIERVLHHQETQPTER
ncbi:MAG: TMEM175 family protein [Candidatus Competibacteraceae bacterium]